MAALMAPRRDENKADLIALAPELEKRRLDALYRYLQLDSVRDEAFDLLTETAAEICQAPYATVSLVDRDRVWIKSGVGFQQGAAVPREEACCARAIVEEGDFLEIPDLSADARSASMTMLSREHGTRMYAGASLVTADGYRIGTLCVMDKEPRQLTQRQRHILGGLAKQVMALIELRAHERMLKDALARAEYFASTDVLTSLTNRRALFERLEQETARCRRYGTPLSAVLIDLDHFKRINDTYGHAAGDAVLKKVGQLIGSSVRELDIAARYGGEEMCVLLPQTGLEGAMSFAQAMRRKIADLSFEFDGVEVHITASFGVASTEGLKSDGQALIKAADVALYSSKREGRNRVSSAQREALP